jgi:hypothetical protein
MDLFAHGGFKQSRGLGIHSEEPIGHGVEWPLELKAEKRRHAPSKPRIMILIIYPVWPCLCELYGADVCLLRPASLMSAALTDPELLFRSLSSLNLRVPFFP